jgi:hypothetical protein
MRRERAAEEEKNKHETRKKHGHAYTSSAAIIVIYHCDEGKNASSAAAQALVCPGAWCACLLSCRYLFSSFGSSRFHFFVQLLICRLGLLLDLLFMSSPLLLDGILDVLIGVFLELTNGCHHRSDE